MPEGQFDDILPVSSELDILWLHHGDESLLEKGRDIEPTMTACFGVKGVEVPGAWRVLDAKVVTIWVEAGMKPALMLSVFGARCHLARTMWLLLSESGRSCSHTTLMMTYLKVSDWIELVGLDEERTYSK